METLIIVSLFAAAAFYLGRKVYTQFNAGSACAKGCAGACNVSSTLEKMSTGDKLPDLK